jgi:hypothetical protein
LDVAHLDPIGWSVTSVPEPTATHYAEVLAELAKALVLWRHAEQASPAGRAGPATPGLFLCLWSPHSGGPFGAGACPDPVWRLRRAVRTRRRALTRTSLLRKGPGTS